MKNKKQEITKERIEIVMRMLNEIKENGKEKAIHKVLRKYGFGHGDIVVSDVEFVFNINKVQPIHARRLIEKALEIRRYRRIKKEVDSIETEVKTQAEEKRKCTQDKEQPKKKSFIEMLKSKIDEWKDNRKKQQNKVTQCQFFYDEDGDLIKVKLSSKNNIVHYSLDVPKKKKCVRKKRVRETKEDLINKEGYKDALILLKDGMPLMQIVRKLEKQQPPIYISKPTLIKLKKVFLS